jgi:hypothetical protein
VTIAIVAVVAVATLGVLIWRRRKVTEPRRPAIDSFALSEPWRRAVAAAQSAERRYFQIVHDTPEGPLRDRLAGIGLSVRKGLEECWQVAKSGDELDDTLGRLNEASLRRDLERATTDAATASLTRQLDGIGRIRAQRDATNENLRSLTAQLGELVTQAAEITSLGVDTDHIGAAVDDVVTQLEGLRLATREVRGMPAAAEAPRSAPDDDPGTAGGQVQATP